MKSMPSQEPSDLLAEKLKRLRQAFAIESDISIRFHLEKQIEQTQAELKLAQQFDDLEQGLSRESNMTPKSTSKKSLTNELSSQQRVDINRRIALQPNSLFERIAQAKNKLLAGGTIIIIVLAGYTTYEYLKQPPQLVEDQALKQKAALVLSETEGNIEEYRQGVIPVKSTNVNLRNFIVEAQFENPYDGAMDNWTYGFAFQENTSHKLNDPQRKSFDIWVTSKEKEWRFSIFSNGKLSNLNVSGQNSNKLSLTVNDKKAVFFVNNTYIATFDISNITNKGDVLLIAKDGISGKSVQYKNLRVWSLDK